MDKDDIVYGNRCILGETLPKPLWAVGETPLNVYLRFSGISLCKTEQCREVPPPPNGRVFKCTQTEWDACNWKYENGLTAWWSLDPNDPVNMFVYLLYNPLNKYYFIATVPTDGDNARFATNQASCSPFNMCGYGGIVAVEWLIEPMNLLKSLNMKGMSDIFMEMHPLVDGNRIYKFCRLQDATNIKILFEP